MIKEEIQTSLRGFQHTQASRQNQDTQIDCATLLRSSGLPGGDESTMDYLAAQIPTELRPAFHDMRHLPLSLVDAVRKLCNDLASHQNLSKDEQENRSNALSYADAIEMAFKYNKTSWLSLPVNKLVRAATLHRSGSIAAIDRLVRRLIQPLASEIKHTTTIDRFDPKEDRVSKNNEPGTSGMNLRARKRH